MDGNKKDMTDIERLNNMLESCVGIKDIVIQTRLMLAVMDALNELEDEVHPN